MKGGSKGDPRNFDTENGRKGVLIKTFFINHVICRLTVIHYVIRRLWLLVNRVKFRVFAQLFGPTFSWCFA